MPVDGGVSPKKVVFERGSRSKAQSILGYQSAQAAGNCRLTDDAVPGVELAGAAKANVGMEVCKAGQPHASVHVREGEGDAVGTGLRDGVPPFDVGVHAVGRLGRAVHPGGRHGVLVVVPGDLRWRKELRLAGVLTTGSSVGNLSSHRLKQRLRSLHHCTFYWG